MFIVEEVERQKRIISHHLIYSKGTLNVLMYICQNSSFCLLCVYI